jgi:putative cofactor-binding repeat protein
LFFILEYSCENNGFLRVFISFRKKTNTFSMKKVVAFGILFLAFNICIYAQVSVSGSTGADGPYTSLKLAFDAINANSNQTGNNIVITLSGSTTETATAALNGSATPWTSLLIYPTVSGNTVSGNLATPLIDLNGADNVTIDGRVNATGSTIDLIITNISTSATAGTSTLRFLNSAENNTVQYCSIKGSETVTTSGVIFFSTSSSGNGNDGNIIRYNNITNSADASRPINAIYSAGASGYINDGGTVTSNSFYNFFNRGATSYGIYLSSYSSAWTLMGNNFYETASFIPASTATYYPIRIDNTSGTGFTISGNFIGGTAAGCGGSAWTKTNVNNNAFYGIYLNVGTGTASNIQGNTLQNFTWSNSSTSTWTGIYVNAGTVNVGTVTGNTIGAGTGTGSVTVTGGASGLNVYGIYIASAGTTDCRNNIIGSITSANTNSAFASNIIGIYFTNAGGATTLNNNVIGSTVTANSLNATSPSTSNAQSVAGIYCNSSITARGNTITNLTNGTTNANPGTAGVVSGIMMIGGANTVTGNTIANLTIGNANTATNSSASATGIVYNWHYNAYVQTIEGNVIKNLSNTYPSFAGTVLGIYLEASSAVSSISGNFIGGFSVNGSSTSATLMGINLYMGAATCTNNIITLGGNTATRVIGLYEDATYPPSTVNFHFNTIYIYGSLTAGVTAQSYAYYSNSNSSPRTLYDNIFMNARSTVSGANLHYAIYYNFGSTTNVTQDYNNCYVTGTGGVLGYFNSSNVNSLPIVPEQDDMTITVDPSFATPGGSNPTDYRPSSGRLQGNSTGTGVTVDYAGATRASLPTIGAYEGTHTGNIEVWLSGVFQARFFTLKEAFDKINDGTYTGAPVIKVAGKVTETASDVLYMSGYLGASYTSVTIYPSNPNVAIIGTMASPLIDLVGADNVTIDGRVNCSGSTKDLVISNKSNSNAAGVSTIRFVNAAENNKIRYCIIKGSQTAANSGVLFFSTAAIGNGNSGNRIDNNNITCASKTNRPVNTLYSAGSPGYENRSDTISNNYFYDFWYTQSNAYAIYLSANSTSWNISGNSFYQTSVFGPGSGYNFLVIRIENTSGTGFAITNNYIGGSSPLCGGSPFSKTGNSKTPFYGMYLNTGTGIGTPTSIQNNTLKNFNWSCMEGPWSGIHVLGGDMNIGDVTRNVIGDTTGTGSLYLYSTGSTNFYGIYTAGTGVINCNNNLIGSITTNDNGNYGVSIYGIYNTSTGARNFNNNKIGSVNTANSLYAMGAGYWWATQVIYGIYSSATTTSPCSISNNILANYTNATTGTMNGFPGRIDGIYAAGGTYYIQNNRISYFTLPSNENTANDDNSAMCGIVRINGGSYVGKITGNIIHHFSQNYNSFSGNLNGIYIYSDYIYYAADVSENFIHSLSVNGASSTTASIYGIRINGACGTFSNNIVTLGGNTQTTLYGIYEYRGSSSSYNELFFNTVYIFGNPGMTATNKSYALYTRDTLKIRDIRSNLFINVRNTPMSSSMHYAIYYTLTGGTFDVDYNDYYVSGGGGVLGYYGGDRTSLAALQAATGQDANSLAIDPSFASAGGTNPSNYYPSATLNGYTKSGIYFDYFGNIRSTTTPKMGALEAGSYLTPGNSVDVYVNGGGSPVASHTDLKSAFDKINDGTYQGSLVLKITGAHKLPATAVLNASGSGSANYTSVQICPTVSGLIVAGNMDAPLIDLNGADNVTIDGRVNGADGSADLVIANESKSTITGTSTTRFINSAENNTVKYCRIRGSESDPASGVIFFSTSTSGNGNDGNRIDYNEIFRSSNTTRPLNIVYSLGSSGYDNSSDSVRYNNIYDFISRKTGSNGINLSSYSSGWGISGNHFYETAYLRSWGINNAVIISINNTTGTGYSLTGNYIGGSAQFCAGSPLSKHMLPEATFTGIYLNAGTGTASSIQGNTIQNFFWPNFSNVGWTGIQVAAGDVNIGTVTGNTIGTATGTGSIWTINNTTGATVYGMNIASSGNIDCRNNQVGSITAGNYNATNAVNIYGIYKTGSGGSMTVSSNTIGSNTTAASINATSASTSNTQTVMGLFNGGSGTVIISNNTIAKLTNGTTNANSGTPGLVNGITTTAGSNTISGNTIYDLTIANASTSSSYQPSVSGIVLNSGSVVTNSISANTVYNLSNTYSSFAGNIYGIYFSGSTTPSTLSGNFVNSLSVTGGSSTAAGIYGIRINAGVTTSYNNIIYLGGNTATTLYGLYDAGASSQHCSLYHNTVYLDGTLGAAVTNKSYALYSNAANNNRDFRNNIFVNVRSTASGTSLHYAAYFNYGVNTFLTLDYNDYYITGTGGVPGYYNSANVFSLPIVTGMDAHSFTADPLFRVPGSLTATGYKVRNNMVGASGTGITVDYGGTTRIWPTIGAWEKINKWKGNLSNNFGNSTNWTYDEVPATDESIIFDDAPVNHCLLDQDRSVTNITNGQAAYRLVTNGHKLTVKGNFVFSNGAQIDAAASGSTLDFAGSGAQTIATGDFYNDEMFHLIINNAVGVTVTNSALTKVVGNVDINSGKTLQVPTGKQVQVSGTFTIKAGGTLTNDGTIILKGDLVNQNP